MKTLFATILLLAGIAAAQTPAPDPRYIGPSAPDPKTMKNPALGQQFTADEVTKLREIIDRVFPPPLEGRTVPEKFRTATVNVFMSSTCPHCAAEVPHFKDLEATGLKINPVFFERDDNAKTFLAGLGWQHEPMVMTSDDLKAIPVRATPLTVVVGKDGKVKKSYAGELTADQRKELVALATAQ